MSIFEEYYSEQKLVDRYLNDKENGIDVIIPVYHTNELWQANLTSIYREVPVRRLLISDGGVIDDSIDVVNRFPRVEVFNHRQYKTLGKCIAELIKEVSSDWFIYVHSDVYLPPNWFDHMIKHKDKYDWYGCPMNITVMVNYRLEEPLRPYAGSQLGRKEAFTNGIKNIDDDFVYRQEDFVFNKIVEDAGFKTGKIEDTFHYHQVMYRKSIGYDLNVTSVKINTKVNEKEQLRSADMQIRGIVKYLDPIEPYVINDFKAYLHEMLRRKELNYLDFRKWVKYTNIRWLPYVSWKLYSYLTLKDIYRSLRNLVKR
jgi:uncharacterized protein Smg (DUF494 family)